MVGQKAIIALGFRILITTQCATFMGPILHQWKKGSVGGLGGAIVLSPPLPHLVFLLLLNLLHLLFLLFPPGIKLAAALGMLA